jgi:hypothetical protein
MRFARGDVRDHIVSHKTTTDLRIGAKEGCSRRDSPESIFARFSASSDFRLLQQYPPVNGHSQDRRACLTGANFGSPRNVIS